MDTAGPWLAPEPSVHRKPVKWGMGASSPGCTTGGQWQSPGFGVPLTPIRCSPAPQGPGRSQWPERRGGRDLPARPLSQDRSAAQDEFVYSQETRLPASREKRLFFQGPRGTVGRASWLAGHMNEKHMAIAPCSPPLPPLPAGTQRSPNPRQQETLGLRHLPLDQAHWVLAGPSPPPGWTWTPSPTAVTSLDLPCASSHPVPSLLVLYGVWALWTQASGPILLPKSGWAQGGG